MKRNKISATILISLGVLILIWVPVLLKFYDALTALFITIGTIIAGFCAEKLGHLFHKKSYKGMK